MKIKRIRRGCYDKFHRCPGWAGGGWKYSDNVVCEDGSLTQHAASGPGGTLDYADPLWRVKFHKCNQDCGTLVLPYFTRWLDPSWIGYRIQRIKKAAVK